jgi:hypothetical protein
LNFYVTAVIAAFITLAEVARARWLVAAILGVASAFLLVAGRFRVKRTRGDVGTTEGARGISLGSIAAVVAAVLLILSALLAARALWFGGRGDDSVEAVRDAARRDASTTAGVAWKEAHTEWLSKAIAPAMTECRRQALEGWRQDFNAYLRLSRTGNVEKALVDPETPFAVCFRDHLKAIRFEDVPQDGYWLEVTMRMGSNPEPSK